MASPQKENGYTPIANEVLEALAGIRIPGQARQCLDVILRKTYGFQKKKDAISLSQFCLITHLGKDKVCKNINKLKGLSIIIAQEGNGSGNIYMFNKDFDTWKPLPKKTMGKKSLPKKTIAIAQKGKASLPSRAHTKETTTKETTTKEILLRPSVAEGNWSYNKTLKKMLVSEKPIMKIIAGYWIAKGFHFDSSVQYQQELRRNLRPAKNLLAYDLAKVGDTMRWLRTNADFKWTLETIEKYINEDLSSFRKKGITILKT